MGKDKKIVFKRVFQVVVSSLVTLGIIGLLIFVTQGRDIPVLDTHGTIADQQRDLIIFVFALGMFVVIPVFILLFAVAWRYRASNKKAVYKPEFDSHKGLELIWWGIPCLVIIVLSIITYVSSHALDPYKPLESKVEPVTVQVVALEWNWLFIYPEKGVATLNYLNVPKDTPINLTITSDAPMNSFWVPALAGQVYAMSGMSTKLHIMANKVGTFNGSSANISGDGFANMRFKVNAMTETDFSKWLLKAAYSPDMLTSESYKTLSQPSKDNGEVTYMLMNKDLYNEIIMKYMAHEKPKAEEKKNETTETHEMNHDMHGMDM